MEKDSLLITIDRLAVNCCRLMTDEERSSFFAYQKDRSEIATHTSSKYFKTEYVRGENKGKSKHVWDIDGQLFNILWSNLLCYVTKSVKYSYSFTKTDIADDVEEIKLKLFKTLRFFGPTPCNMPLSKFLHILVNNYLTNIYNEKRRKLSTKEDLKVFEIIKCYKKLSKQFSNSICISMLTTEYPEYSKADIEHILYEVTTDNSVYTDVTTYKEEYLEDCMSSKKGLDTNYIPIVETLSNNNYEELLFFVELPDDLIESSELLIGGTSMIQTAEQVGTYRRKLKDKYVAFITER